MPLSNKGAIMNIPQPNNQSADKQYLHTLSAGAFLPFMQATGFGLAVFVAVFVIALFVFDAMDPHKPALLFGVIAWVVMLYRLFRHWLNLTTFETVIQRDINGDGVIGRSEQVPVEEEAPRVIRIQLVKDDGHLSADTIDLPGDRESLGTLARGLLNGMPFSESMWTGKGKPFSSKSFRALRDVMKQKGLCEYINESDPRQGIRLTEEGRQVMQHFASPHSPTSEEEA